VDSLGHTGVVVDNRTGAGIVVDTGVVVDDSPVGGNGVAVGYRNWVVDNLGHLFARKGCFRGGT